MNHQSTILIVDDEPVGRRILEVLLADQNYHLVTASNGMEALELAAECVPDLVLLDVMMPRMDGFEVCRRLRADPLLAGVPVIMVTALDDRDSRLRGMEVGADDFITKPIDRLEVRKRVQTITRLDRYRRLLMEREQRQHAEEQIHRRNRELTLLNNVISAAASTLDVDTVLRIACKALAEALDLPVAVALLFDTNGTQASSNASYNGHSAPAPPVAAASPDALAALLADKAPVMLNRARPDQPVMIAPHFNNETQWHALLLPLLIRDEVVGYIELRTDNPRSLGEHDFALVQSIAGAVGQAIENARLYQQLQRHADQLEETVAQRTEELRLERDRTSAMLEALAEAVVVTDKNGIVQYVNPAVTDLSGFCSDELVGQTWQFCYGDAQAEERSAQILDHVRRGNTWRGEALQQHHNGTMFDIALTVAPIFDPYLPDSLMGIVSVQRDVTPLKEAERLKDQFVSNVSHELRTPLSIITLLSGNLDTLYDRLEEPKRKSMIRDIREHSQVLSDLINSVLEISRIDSRRISNQQQPLDLALLVSEEAERQRPLAHKKQQTLEILGDTEIMIIGNDGQVRQVVRNLLNNAIKYTPAGGTVCCEYRELSTAPSPVSHTGLFWSLLDEDTHAVWPGRESLPAGHWAAVRVFDTGIGIAPDDLPHIFERFYRVQSQSTIPGTGLGLSIVRELVDLHGGHLAIASKPGCGSVIAMYMPLLEEDVL